MVDKMTFKEIERAIQRSPAIEDIDDPNNYRFSELIMGEGQDIVIPETYSLRDRMTPVKNQGARGTCVGFASTSITEYFNAKEWSKPDLDLSEEMLYRKIKDVDVADYNYSGYGAYSKSGAKALNLYGTCLDITLPYNSKIGDDGWKNIVVTEYMLKEAEEYKMLNYLMVQPEVEKIQRAILASDGPVMGAVTLYESYRKASSNGGLIPLRVSGEKVIGGHEIVFTGWTKTHFEIKNSWGAAWGDKGYIYWPFAGIKDVHSLWSFIDLLTNPLVKTEAVIQENRKRVSSYALVDWDKAIALGYVNEGTLPLATVSKQDFFVFMGRLGLLK